MSECADDRACVFNLFVSAAGLTLVIGEYSDEVVAGLVVIQVELLFLSFTP